MIILKIGGGASINLEEVCRDIAVISEPMVIVHGANAVRDELAMKLGVSISKITGVSGYTSIQSTPELIEVMLMSYAGLQNKRIVSLLHQVGVNAIGLSGIDGMVVQGRRNKGIRAKVKDKTVLMRDESGKPHSINEELLNYLIQQNYVPVITQPIGDEQGKLINSENDDLVAILAKGQDADTVIMLIEEPGLLEQRDNSASVVRFLDHEELSGWTDKVQGRMQRKLMAIGNILSPDCRVIISDGRISQPITKALSGQGTVIQW